MEPSQAHSQSPPVSLSIFTWAVVLLVSDLPNAVWQASGGEPPAWLFWVKIGLLVVIILYQPGVETHPTGATVFHPVWWCCMLALWGMNWLMETAT